MHRIIVTGDREWTDEYMVSAIFRSLRSVLGPDVKIVHGACRGLDLIAAAVASDIFGVQHVEGYPALWDTYGDAAGPIRNGVMLSESLRKGEEDGFRLTAGLGFHDNIQQSTGTADMLRKLDTAGIKTHLVTHAWIEIMMIQWVMKQYGD